MFDNPKRYYWRRTWDDETGQDGKRHEDYRGYDGGEDIGRIYQVNHSPLNAAICADCRSASAAGCWNHGAIRLSEEIEADGKTFFRVACELGLEGIVAKHRARPYRSVKRPEWLKIKCVRRDNFAIVGFEPSTVPGAIGRLLLAARKDDSSKPRQSCASCCRKSRMTRRSIRSTADFAGHTPVVTMAGTRPR